MELQHESVDEESELKAFNDPFEVITESFVRRRHGETDPIRISEEDDQLLASLIDSGGLEESIIRDTLSKLVSMQCVSERLALQVQEEYEFEKFDFNASSGLTALDMQHIEDQSAELELEELILMLESGKDENKEALDEKRISDIEKRILELDAEVRQRKKKPTSKKS
jgi:DNA primase large subunit